MRTEYDSWRHSGMMISFKKWFTMKDVIKTVGTMFFGINNIIKFYLFDFVSV